jgi:hypothetical protein
VHGLSHGEIAAILSVSRGATETLLFRAREAFRHGYSTLVGSEPRHACNLARQAVVDSVGGGLSPRQRRRIIAHAKGCPECRETVSTWSLGAFGLVAFLHVAPLPAALATPPFAAAIAGGVAAGAGVGAAGGAGVGAAGGSGVGAAGGSGVGAAGGAAAGAAAGGASAGAAVTAGAAIKAAILAVAAGTLVVAGGVTTHHLAAPHRHVAENVAVVSHANAPRGAQARPLGAGHNKSQAGAVGSRGEGGAAGAHKASGATHRAGHAQNKHVAGSAAKAHGKPAVSPAHGNSGHAAKSRRPLTKKRLSVGKTPTAKQKPTAKKKV